MERRAFLLAMLAAPEGVRAANIRPVCRDGAAGQASEAVLKHHLALGWRVWQDCLGRAGVLHRNVLAFLDSPTEGRLRAAKDSWIVAHGMYGKTLALAETPEHYGLDYSVNAWPVKERNLDYVSDCLPESTCAPAGAINDPSMALVRILEFHGADYRDVTRGWHAIEFMLWGGDGHGGGYGKRPVADYLPVGKRYADRRRDYLKLICDVLLSDLRQMARYWNEATSGGWYRAFHGDGCHSLRELLLRMIHVATEDLAADRMEALLRSDYPEEESPYSGTSHLNVVNMLEGLQIVWEGRYRALSGKLHVGASPSALLRGKNPELARDMTRRLDLLTDMARAMRPPYAAYHSEAEGGARRAHLMRMVELLHALGKDISAAAVSLNLGALPVDFVPNTREYGLG